ncbi:unnamed protein product, partial [Menidia menidia]
IMVAKVLCAVILLVCALKFNAAQASCKGRCGGEYYRGYMCQCDYSCLSYGECCKDFEAQCTTKSSCKGRCGENFKRGRQCSCDPDCAKYKQCCQDFEAHCEAEEPTLNEATEQTPFVEGNDADDYTYPLDSTTSYPPDDLVDDLYDKVPPTEGFSLTGVDDLEVNPTPDSSSGNGPPTNDSLDQGPTEPALVTDTPEITTDSVVLQTKETYIEDDNPPILNSTAGDATTENSDAGDVLTAADQRTTFTEVPVAPNIDSSQPFSTSVPQIESTTTRPDKLHINTTVHPSDEQDFTTITDQNSDTVEEISPPTSTVTLNPEETTSNADIGNNTEDFTMDPPPLLKEPEDLNTTELDKGTFLHSTPFPAAVQDDATDGLTPVVTTAQAPTNPQKPGPDSKPQEKPDPQKLTPTSKPETKPLDTLNVDNPRDYQADDSNDTNLCSGRPVSAVTTLRNGTMVVFRGHYFWFLDRNRVPSPARGITQVWGVPSPIDTVFTRCNCQGKTYIFKGSRYWRFENDVVDPGYPKVIKTGFDGLQGQITAALSVPQYRTRRESVFFFKRGGHVQKYSYQFGTGPTCGKKVHNPIYTVRARLVRQAVSVLEPVINIRTAWAGFPSTITAAVSVPSNREPEGYKYYVFSRSTAHSVKINGERPVITASKANTSPQTNNFFRCPKKL